MSTTPYRNVGYIDGESFREMLKDTCENYHMYISNIVGVRTKEQHSTDENNDNYEILEEFLFDNPESMRKLLFHIDSEHKIQITEIGNIRCDGAICVDFVRVVIMKRKEIEQKPKTEPKTDE